MMNALDTAFQKAADYATALGYEQGSGPWWQALRHGLRILAGCATYGVNRLTSDRRPVNECKNDERHEQERH